MLNIKLEDYEYQINQGYHAYQKLFKYNYNLDDMIYY